MKILQGNHILRGCNLCSYFRNSRFKTSSSVSDNVEISLSKGKKLKLSKSGYARFSDGCAVGEIGNTTVLVTAVSKEKSTPASFVPLTVDYRQKAAAAGRIPTNHLRRELGPSDHEILTSRIIDRSIRPLFPTGFSNETQLTCNLLAVDGANDPDVVSINTASAALMLSDIPWNGPVGAVRVGLLDDELISNPTRKELTDSSLNLIVVAANHNLVVMLEGGANNILKQDFCKAIKFGVKECQPIIKSQLELANLGKLKRTWNGAQSWDESVVNFINLKCESKLREILTDCKHDKISRDTAVQNLLTEVIKEVKSGVPNFTQEIESYCSSIFSDLTKNIFRSLILEDKRCDGRKIDQLRDISCKVNLYSPLHGSSLFQRGQTQVLCTVALDSLESSIKLDPMTVLHKGFKEKNFFLHYHFPGYATNDFGKSGTVRRDIGHGALAERALRPLVPNDFPFAIRLTSEVLESNGSSSMASVCGGSLALMDAGVPIESAAAGVAIGLVTDNRNGEPKNIEKYKILTDILGIEDYMGDMDFKMAGTKKGITAIQADVKIPGVPLKIIMDAISAATVAKNEILDIMNAAISEPRKGKENWPVSEKLEIESHKRGKFIGPGGINLKKLLFETGVQITPQDDGSFLIFAPNKEVQGEAKEQIEAILAKMKEPTLDFGGIYKAKIVELREIGVMVELYDGMMPALVHNSQLDQRKVNHPSVLGFKVGDEINVKYFGRDPVSGSIRLSRKIITNITSGSVKNLN